MLATLIVIGGCIAYAVWLLGRPGRSHSGALPPLSPAQRESAEYLRRNVAVLAARPRHVGEAAAHAEAAAFLERRHHELGYSVVSQHYEVARGVPVRNLEIVIPGGARRGETIVIGAHYDSTDDGPGANDNASGSAAWLERARVTRGVAEVVRVLASP